MENSSTIVKTYAYSGLSVNGNDKVIPSNEEYSNECLKIFTGGAVGILSDGVYLFKPSVALSAVSGEVRVVAQFRNTTSDQWSDLKNMQVIGVTKISATDFIVKRCIKGNQLRFIIRTSGSATGDTSVSISKLL